MRNLGKKDNRLQVLKYEFENLTKNGYTKEEYKDINIFTLDKDGVLILKVYRGTSTNPIHYIRYRTRERIQEVTKQYKDWADLREKRKEEQGGKRTLTGAALCAASIRTELKNNFPTYKFSVTSDNFSGGDSVHISWKDGPTTKQVDSIVNRYQYGHFNGMEDIYEYSNNIEGLPQAKYVSTHREINPDLKNRLLPEFEKLYKSEEPEYSRNSTVNTLNRILSNTEIKSAENVKGIAHNGKNGILEDCFMLTYNNEEKETVKAEIKPNIKPIESEAGEVNIIEYSEKAIAVIGDTKPIKELLKNLGGSFNARLSCGPGWIFSKKRMQELQTALININNARVEEEETQDLTPVLYSEINPLTQEAEEIQEIPGPPPAINEALTLESFKNLWHEGRHIEGAIFENKVFTDWQEVQKAFFKLWEVNEKGSDEGYTKVKCEIKLKGSDLITDRIDITNRIKNGDFNPSDMHILEYLESILTEEESQEQPREARKHPELEYIHPLNICDPQSPQYKEALKEYEEEKQHAKKYESLQEITAAANAGKQISIYNLFSLVQEPTKA